MNQAQPLLKLSTSKSETNGVENLIRTISKEHRTPFMLIRQSILEKQFNRFRKALPEVTPYYAIKANPYPDIIEKLGTLGANFDVASAAEMKHVLNLGIAPSRIIFANTIKSCEDIS